MSRAAARYRAAMAAILLLAAGGRPAAAAEVRIFQTNTQAAFLAGTLEGISVDPQGRLRLADRVERVAAVGEPFLFSAAAHPDGWVVGTGNAGRVLLVTRGGEVRELFAAAEPEIFAVWADPDGTVFAASSPGGKVYRIPAGGPGEAFFDPGEVYIWALARDAGGGLLVATGTEGRLYRVDSDGAGEVVYDSEDSHLRSLLPLPGGEVLIGTAGEGLLQLLSPRDGGFSARTLYDAAEPEVAALAAAPDGRLWAAAVASEASQVDLGAAAASSNGGDGSSVAAAGDDEPSVTVVVESGPSSSVTAGSRRAGHRGPRSRLLEIAPGGRVEELWQLDDETVFDLSYQRGRLWVATGLGGKLYSHDGGQLVLEKDVDEEQVVALVAGDPGPVFATTNAAALFRVSGGIERRGVYTSAALDAGQIARFGTLRWRGLLPDGAKLEIAFRSGVSAEPDATWSEWTPWRPASGRGAGEVALAGVDPGRYIQWRVRLAAADGVSPQLFAVELSYRQENLRPRIEKLTVLDPGEVLVPSNFNPSNQVYEPTGPNRDGIFTTLEAAADDGDVRLKTLYKRGWRSLRWEVEDDNGDDQLYRLSFRPASGADGAPWLPMAEELDDEHYSFDASVLPDGLYRFRLESSDRPDNDPAEALVAERLSEPVTIDHGPPRLLGVERRGGTLRATVADDHSPLRSAEVSVDGAAFVPAMVADGLLDGRREVLELAVPEDARLVVLRVLDAAFNDAAFDLTSP